MSNSEPHESWHCHCGAFHSEAEARSLNQKADPTAAWRALSESERRDSIHFLRQTIDETQDPNIGAMIQALEAIR